MVSTAANRSPAIKPTRVYRVPGVSYGEKDKTYRPPIVVPTGRHPLPEASSNVAMPRRSFVRGSVGGGAFSYPWVSPYQL